jgi:hypothetical protein
MTERTGWKRALSVVAKAALEDAAVRAFRTCVRKLGRTPSTEEFRGFCAMYLRGTR